MGVKYLNNHYDFDLAHSIGYQINRTALRLKTELLKQFLEQGFDVTTEQWQVLNHLWEEDGLSQKQISQKSFKDYGNISRILDVLQRKGFVTRLVDQKDQRYYRIHLTDAGLALHQPMTSIAIGILESAKRGISEEEINLLILLLNRIYDNLSENEQ
jgi:DNA-binding MarR family transcriptional regulator